jgi:4-hydroxybenzoate polyprenyltransferase
MSRGGVLRGLVLSCHPIPSLAVTALSAGLLALAGTSPARGAVAVTAVLSGQLSIGWSNDFLDAERDRAVQRADKPLARNTLDPRVVGVAACAALLVTVVASALLGWPAGAAALLIVVCGWAYNLGLKATVWSWVPYAIAFGTLPAVATLAARDARLPPWWATAAGALLGVAAHLANVLPDLGEDAATGVRGLPHYLGARGTAVTAAVLLLGASAVILFGPGGSPGAGQWLGFLATAALAAVSTRAALRNPTSRTFFLAIIGIALLDLLFFAFSGAKL